MATKVFRCPSSSLEQSKTCRPLKSFAFVVRALRMALLHCFANRSYLCVALKDVFAVGPREWGRNLAGRTNARAGRRLVVQVGPLKVQRVSALDPDTQHRFGGGAAKWRLRSLVAIHVEEDGLFASGSSFRYLLIGFVNFGCCPVTIILLPGRVTCEISRQIHTIRFSNRRPLCSEGS